MSQGEIGEISASVPSAGREAENRTVEVRSLQWLAEGPRDGALIDPSHRDGSLLQSAEVVRLEAGLEPDARTPERLNALQDVMEMLLADKRSENTRRAYRYDLTEFFRAVYGAEPTPELVGRFLALNTPQMAAVILRYKAHLIAEHLAEATVNRRLAAVMSLVKMARRVGATEANPRDQVDTEKVVAYRDTRGITAEQARLLLRLPDRTTLKGKRDFALLLLLLENALRRAEIVGLTVGDFDGEARTIFVKGKGRGTQKEWVTLSPVTVAALREYLREFSHTGHREAPLFINVSPACYGKGLMADGLYKIVREYAHKAGLMSRLSPHRLRHTAITMALDASGGDIRRVKRLSRHARLETLQIYDDNRSDLQGEMTNLLSAILAAPMNIHSESDPAVDDA